MQRLRSVTALVVEALVLWLLITKRRCGCLKRLQKFDLVELDVGRGPTSVNRGKLTSHTNARLKTFVPGLCELLSNTYIRFAAHVDLT